MSEKDLLINRFIAYGKELKQYYNQQSLNKHVLFLSDCAVHNNYNAFLERVCELYSKTDLQIPKELLKVKEDSELMSVFALALSKNEMDNKPIRIQ